MMTSRMRLLCLVRLVAIVTAMILAIYVLHTTRASRFSKDTSLPSGQSPDERGRQVKSRCALAGEVTSSATDSRQRLLVYEPLGVTLCYAPKAGCTFWKRVFLSLQKTRNGVTSNVFNLKKNSVHYTKIGNLDDIKSFGQSYSYLSKSKRFLFVRDPYSRLYSAYIDKFYLGDFWVHGKNIIRKLRRSSVPLTCGHDLTFTEFLQMATNPELSAAVGPANEHWLPISAICTPCLYEYQYIGKLETFDADRKFLMRTLGIDAMVKSTISRDDTVRDAIVQATQTYWDKNVNGCMTKGDYLMRLYESFKIQGYLPLDSHPDFNGNVTQNDFTNKIWDEYKKRGQTMAEWESQRRTVLRQAYASVPLEVKNAIAETYKLDFHLFDYNSHPSDIFT